MGAERGEPGPGDQIAGHRIQALVGRGSQSWVYRAWHEPSAGLRALKLQHRSSELAAAIAEDPARHLLHPDIVRTWDSGTEGPWHWLSLEWVPGHDLARYTHPKRLLPEQLALTIARRLALALDHAHRAGVTHRDIKPANVRVHLPANIVKLADFGIARQPDSSATVTGVLKGTPAYMAPEMLAGASVSAATDLYALGVVLYELLCGRRPHEADSMGELLRKLASTRPTRIREHVPQLPQVLDDLLARLVSPRAGDRPPSGQALAEELALIVQALPQH
jgi:eukaryotic-like serine/threonine-protein kinase